jgi:hypothetical protein
VLLPLRRWQGRQLHWQQWQQSRGCIPSSNACGCLRVLSTSLALLFSGCSIIIGTNS